MMKSKKSQDTVLEACSEEVRQYNKLGISRRQFVQTSAGVVAAGALLGKKAFASSRPLKIGLVSPKTGPLAPLAEFDAFVVDEIRKVVQGGIQSGGATRPVDILVRDSQSNSNRAAEVAAELIKSDQVDLMLAASTPNTVNPVADQCEINHVPCVSTDCPWQVFFFGRGGKPAKGFDWTYHFFWGTEAQSQVVCNMFEDVPTNKVVGLLLGDDADGIIIADPVKGCPPAFEARGLKIFDSGRFQLDTTDFSAQIAAFKNANAELLFGVLPLPTFSNFWAQAAQQGFKPKVATIGKALSSPSAVDSLGARGKDLTSPLNWSPAYPFNSSLTGQSAAQLCDAYEEVTKKQWSPVLGPGHTLFEVAIDVFKRAQNPESAASVIEAVRTTKLNTITGPIQWLGTPPNQWTKIPVKNACTTPLVGGQWVPGKKWMYDFVVVDNKTYPLIPAQHKVVPLPA
jgi:branched-chain amino acid transport system substrate-binding protein